jgi:hypothetical protein
MAGRIKRVRKTTEATEKQDLFTVTLLSYFDSQLPERIKFRKYNCISCQVFKIFCCGKRSSKGVLFLIYYDLWKCI